jgi:hypothetical protein
MEKLQRSWQLLKTSFTVMQRDRKLLLFPILTTIFTVLLALLFICPVAFQRTGYGYLSAEHWKAAANSVFVMNSTHPATASAPEQPSERTDTEPNIGGVRPLGVAYFALMYFVSMFCATFFNVAFYHQILAALNGQPVSIAGGLRFALSRWQAILMWTLFAGLVGYLIQALERRLNFVGQLIMKLIGTAWSIACVFVIPVLITEDTANPFQVLKKSALTLKKTWGESLIGYAGVSFGSAIILLVSLVWLAGGIALSMAYHLYWLTVLIVLGWLVAIILWSYVLSVASQIFRCALFVYASQGTLPPPYTQDMIALAWKQKK